jgi:hypothetical protein
MGNHKVPREVRGQELVNLALFQLVYPATSLDYARAFIHNMDPTGVPFLPMAVCCAEHLLSLWQKASSTTCQRAFLPLNKHKRHAFWTFNHPFGRANVRTQDMIDVKEAGFKIENANLSFGKTVLWLHCYLEGEYNRDKKVDCIMAIFANPHYDMECHNIWPQEESRTDLFWVYVFL